MSNINENAERIEALKEYLVNSRGLVRILEKETEYYKDMKMNQAEKLVESKQSIISKIEGYKAKLTSDISFLKKLPKDVKDKITETTIALGRAADENYREAVKAKEVNRVILESVSKALAEAKRDSSAYSKEGYGNGKENKGGSPVAYNENV